VRVRGDRRAATFGPVMIPFPRHLANLAEAAPDRPWVTDDDRTISRRDLLDESRAVALHLADLGVGVGDFVTIGLPNGIGFVRAVFACWMVGAIPQPVSSRLPAPELAAIVEVAGSKLVIDSEWVLPPLDRRPDVGELPDDVVSP